MPSGDYSALYSVANTGSVAGLCHVARAQIRIRFGCHRDSRKVITKSENLGLSRVRGNVRVPKSTRSCSESAFLGRNGRWSRRRRCLRSARTGAIALEGGSWRSHARDSGELRGKRNSYYCQKCPLKGVGSDPTPLCGVDSRLFTLLYNCNISRKKVPLRRRGGMLVHGRNFTLSVFIRSILTIPVLVSFSFKIFSPAHARSHVEFLTIFHGEFIIP
jgi:hypothetical protein